MANWKSTFSQGALTIPDDEPVTADNLDEWLTKITADLGKETLNNDELIDQITNLNLKVLEDYNPLFLAIADQLYRTSLAVVTHHSLPPGAALPATIAALALIVLEHVDRLEDFAKKANSELPSPRTIPQSTLNTLGTILEKALQARDFFNSQQS